MSDYDDWKTTDPDDAEYGPCGHWHCAGDCKPDDGCPECPHGNHDSDGTRTGYCLVKGCLCLRPYDPTPSPTEEPAK